VVTFSSLRSFLRLSSTATGDGRGAEALRDAEIPGGGVESGVEPALALDNLTRRTSSTSLEITFAMAPRILEGSPLLNGWRASSSFVSLAAAAPLSAGGRKANVVRQGYTI
jgi:hypothetical protein